MFASKQKPLKSFSVVSCLRGNKECGRVVNRKVILGLAVILLIGIISGCSLLEGVFGSAATADSTRFKNEYEALNSEKNDDGTNKYTYLSIDKVNNVSILSYEDLMEFINSKTGLLYFGRPACPWCRLLVPMMLEYAKEDMVTIYYYDIEKDRDENNERYKSVLAVLGEYLPTDTVTQKEDDPGFDPDLKRVVLPQLFFIRDGEVKAELYFYQHEFLRDNDTANVKQMLRYSYDAIAPRSDIDKDCDC